MPKTRMDHGIAVTSDTGWDKFGQFLTGFMQQQQQVHQEHLVAQARADEAEAQQTEFRTTLAKIADANPDLYNSLVDDPGVRKFLDVGKPAAMAARSPGSMFDRFRERKANAAKAAALQSGPGLEKIGEDSPTMKSFRLGQKAEAAKAGSAISLADLQTHIAEARKNGLSSDNIIDNLVGLTGSVPSVSDVAVAGGKVSPEAASATIPGTLAWKQTQANSISTEMATKYQVKDNTDLQRVKAMAEWQMGLREAPPEKLPASFAQLELDLNTQGQKLRAQQFGFDVAKYHDEQRQQTLSTAFALTQYGIDPATATSAADSYLKTGKFPPGVTLGPDKKKELDMKLEQARYDKLQADLSAAMVSDPEMASLVKTIQLTPPDQRVGSPYWNRMNDKMKSQFGWTVNNPSTWDKILGSIQQKTGIVAPSLGLTKGRGVAGISTGGNAPTEPETKAIMTPELEASGTDTAQKAMQAYAVLPPGDQQKLRPYMQSLAAARSAGDVSKVAQAIKDLQDQLSVLRVQ